MKKIYLILLNVMILTVINSYAQINLQDQVSGRSYNLMTVDKIDGSPFLFENWQDGTVKFKNGQIYNDLKLKYDLHSNVLLYNQNDSLYEFINPIESFHFINVKNNGFDNEMFFTHLPNAKQNNSIFAHIIVKGKISLVRFYEKSIQEVAEYGSASKSRIYVNKASTFFVVDEDIRAARFTQQELDKLISDKQENVFSYIKKNRLNPKNEQDFITVLRYFNGLF